MLEEQSMRWIGLVVGILAVAVGVLWTLQGLNIVGGSVMSGNHTFIIVGPLVGLVGLGLIIFSRRRASAA
jgi:hypothetical protein